MSFAFIVSRGKVVSHSVSALFNYPIVNLPSSILTIHVYSVQVRDALVLGMPVLMLFPHASIQSEVRDLKAIVRLLQEAEQGGGEIHRLSSFTIHSLCRVISCCSRKFSHSISIQSKLDFSFFFFNFSLNLSAVKYSIYASQ